MVITDNSIGVSQLFGGRPRVAPPESTPMVAALDAPFTPSGRKSRHQPSIRHFCSSGGGSKTCSRASCIDVSSHEFLINDSFGSNQL